MDSAGQSWLTFRQALSLGGHVRKGERGTTVVYADRFVPAEEKRCARETGKEVQPVPFLKRFTVFNTDQCNDLPIEIATTAPPPLPGMIEPAVEVLIEATGIEFRIGGNRAFYAPTEDYVQVPPPAAYFEPINWHRTALHELCHASGHSSRLNRDLGGSYGSKKYAFEELIAELGAAFSCASLGIVPTVRHADYIGSWLEVLREDNRAIARAASQATKAADYLLAFLPEMTKMPPLTLTPEIRRRRDGLLSKLSRKRAAGLGWRPREALSASRRGGPIWPRPPGRSSFRVRATFPSISIMQPCQRMPSISTAARWGNPSGSTDDDRTGSSRLQRIGSPNSTVSSRSTSSPAAIFVCFCLSRPGHGDLLLRLANATREERIAWWRTVNVAA